MVPDRTQAGGTLRAWVSTERRASSAGEPSATRCAAPSPAVSAGHRPWPWSWASLGSASRASRRVLARLLPGLAGQPLAALGTCRASGAPPVLEQLRPADVVDLVGLDATEVAELVAHLHPAEALDPAELVERTAGNPLLIRELVRSSAARLPTRVRLGAPAIAARAAR